MTNKLLLGTPLLLIAMAPCLADESLYAGKPLAFWMKRLESDEVLLREEALIVLTEAAPTARAAIPRIEKLLHSEPLMLRTRAALAWRRLTGDDKPALAAAAAMVLSGMGAPAADKVLPLLDREDAALRVNVCLVLGNVGPDARAAVPRLKKLLADKDARVRQRAALALGQIGPAARDAASALVETVRDANLVVRRTAL